MFLSKTPFLVYLFLYNQNPVSFDWNLQFLLNLICDYAHHSMHDSTNEIRVKTHLFVTLLRHRFSYPPFFLKWEARWKILT